MATPTGAVKRGTPPQPTGTWFDQNRPPESAPGAGGHDTLNPPTAGSGGDPMALIEQWQGELSPGPDAVAEIVNRLRKAGIPAALATHEGGSKASSDAIVLPDGRVIDVVRGWDGPNPSWALAHVDNYDPSRNVIGMNGEFVPFGDYASGLGFQPSNAQPFAGSSRGGGGGSAGAMAGIDPSYEFITAEGQKALERSAASKGTLLTGGTLKAITRYGQDMASREFGNIFDRNYKLSGLGLDAAQINAGTGTAYSGNAGNAAANYGNNAANLTTGQGNVNAAGQIGSANAWTGTLADIANIAGQYVWNRRRPGTIPNAGIPGAATPPYFPSDWQGPPSS